MSLLDLVVDIKVIVTMLQARLMLLKKGLEEGKGGRINTKQKESLDIRGLERKTLKVKARYNL